VRNCLQELNKVVANHNGTFVSGEGYLETCQNENVFEGRRFGIILSANCPDDNGDWQSATMYFQLSPAKCHDN
jgi:hypothetical protein